MTDDEIIDAVIHRECGYVNDPNDAGGPTKYGITLATLMEWRHRPIDAGDLIALTEREAREIYRTRYIERPGYGLIGWGSLRAATVDAAVNHGTYQATRTLQRVAGVKEDGVIGPLTLDALAALGERRALVRFAAERVRLYGRIISSKPEQAKFAAGWLNRAAEFIEALDS